VPRQGFNASRCAGGAGWIAGFVVAAAYLVVLLCAWPSPIRVLYDGLVPLPPYRWVHPPAGRAGDNQPALAGAATVRLGPPSQAVEVSTDDDQALITLPRGAIEPRAGETAVKVTIVPLDPATVGVGPGPRRFDGNAYRIEAKYADSAQAAVLTVQPTVVLRYPVHATLILRFDQPAWTALPGQVFTGSQQVLANTDRLGVFVAAAQ